MKPLLLFLVLLSAVAASGATNSLSISATNGTLFDCQGGASFTSTNIILRDHVRVLDHQSGMYLECDLLTIKLQTNTTKQASPLRSPSPKPAASAGRTNQFDSGRLEEIVAEGNVYITTLDQQIVGDRAVYTATNDLFVVTGEMVILGVQQGVGLCKKAIFDRTTGTAHAVGEAVFESLGQISLSSTNSPPRKRNTNGPPPGATPPASK